MKRKWEFKIFDLKTDRYEEVSVLSKFKLKANIISKCKQSKKTKLHIIQIQPKQL